jgi:hypothetical protein
MLCCVGLSYHAHLGSSRRIGQYLCVGALLAVGIAAADSSAAIVASCADGSVVIAKKWKDVHCMGALVVAPGNVPPLGTRPGHPSPASQASRSQQEAARERDLEAQITSALAARIPSIASVREGSTLTEPQRRRLARLIEDTQKVAAAAVERAVPGLPPLRMRLAHLPSFEERLRPSSSASASNVSGPILVFSLDPTARGLEGPPPSFAQGGITFRPDVNNLRELGWIGDGGAVDPTATRLGYVGLPAGFDPSRPLVLLWGDAVSAAWLAPRP